MIRKEIQAMSKDLHGSERGADGGQASKKQKRNVAECV